MARLIRETILEKFFLRIIGNMHHLTPTFNYVKSIVHNVFNIKP